MASRNALSFDIRAHLLLEVGALLVGGVKWNDFDGDGLHAVFERLVHLHSTPGGVSDQPPRPAHGAAVQLWLTRQRPLDVTAHSHQTSQAGLTSVEPKASSRHARVRVIASRSHQDISLWSMKHQVCTGRTAPKEPAPSRQREPSSRWQTCRSRRTCELTSDLAVAMGIKLPDCHA